MKTAPKGTNIHWKLMWRDLCEDWTSPAGRLVQVGDSAHSFLPSSGNGASQAMEDAITLATCLQLGGKSNVPSATRVYNKLWCTIEEVKKEIKAGKSVEALLDGDWS
ncbi:FAD-dependent monooxygenase dmxR9 [Lepraria neglecta]|uniref:FAD-dependent monooxygenase dmxR9 n=1 Tax=Lepraria neglecta TaxID=209136 RepID=A0AAE0DI46_9LECA|nr:FAD-dependent monooxygenase dmxR9 [Lepraria neglecta]